jgi:hypothetical protein
MLCGAKADARGTFRVPKTEVLCLEGVGSFRILPFRTGDVVQSEVQDSRVVVNDLISTV